jgi:hypothetical protein
VGTPAAALGLVLCVVVVAPALGNAFRIAAVRGRAAAALRDTIGPETRRDLRPGSLVAIDRRWQGALALYAGISRLRIVPLEAVGGVVAPARIGAVVVLGGADGPRPTLEFPRRATARSWRLFAPKSW